jgi:hypothetical protein
MVNIFFSYSSKDNQLVDEITRKLTDPNINIFMDQFNLQAGDNWKIVLSDHLKNADILISVLTENSVNSSWFSSEMSAAFGYFKESGKPRVLPIYFDNVPLPEEINHIQVLTASRDNIEVLVRKLRESIFRIMGELQANTEQKQQIIEKVEKSSENYIQTSLQELRKRENSNKRLSYFCYILSYVSLLLCVLLAVWRGSNVINMKIDNGIMIQLQFAFISILIFSLIIALSRLTFILGKSFMVESLRNADRIHAISFGEFYLKAYGDKVDWKEIKDVFQHWNIDKGSAFITQSTNEFDPELLKYLIEFTKIITNTRK